MSGFKNNLLIFFLCKVVSWKLYSLQTQKTRLMIRANKCGEQLETEQIKNIKKN